MGSYNWRKDTPDEGHVALISDPGVCLGIKNIHSGCSPIEISAFCAGHVTFHDTDLPSQQYPPPMFSLH